MGRLDFAMEGRDEAFIVEWREEEARHGIATAESVSWLPTSKIPEGRVEMSDKVKQADKAAVVAEAEEKIRRSKPSGEVPEFD